MVHAALAHHVMTARHAGHTLHPGTVLAVHLVVLAVHFVMFVAIHLRTGYGLGIRSGVMFGISPSEGCAANQAGNGGCDDQLFHENTPFIFGRFQKVLRM
jgi:hypothetical protein